MSNVLGNRSRKRLDGVHPTIMDIIEFGIVDCPFDFGIPADGGKRNHERQCELYARGRTTAELQKKGIMNVEGEPHRDKITWTLRSKHLPKKDGYGYAFDLYAYVGGKASWSMKYLEPIARHLQKVALEEFGIKLIWGQDVWGKDAAHFQIEEYA
tara:strand:- start:1025 stop:1489 length:465 start_codon:yes stop_codon:yes gene_type:complete